MQNKKAPYKESMFIDNLIEFTGSPDLVIAFVESADNFVRELDGDYDTALRILRYQIEVVEMLRDNENQRRNDYVN